jgi:glycosyltransferase involved in cell wall biosynthesis
VAEPAAPSLAVLLSTYNQPDWLEKVLLGYAAQTFTDFELIVADDGSRDDTRARMEALRPQLPYPLHHVWHPDDGFRKCTILNRAIEAARADYLVFSDGDCIPRADFLAVHAGRRQRGRFLSGGYVKLPRSTSAAIGAADIASGRHCDPAWLAQHGFAGLRRQLKLRARGLGATLLDALTPARASWNGHNASGWKADLVAANGFDERMRYGGEDRELGERLENAGIRGLRVRYHAIVVHLDHERGYVLPQMIEDNRRIRAATRSTRATRTDYGLRRTGTADARD